PRTTDSAHPLPIAPNRLKECPALGGGDVGYITDPNVVGLGGGGTLFEAVGRDRQRVSAVSGARAKGALLQSAQAVVTHQSSNAVAAARDVLFFERLSHARAAVGFTSGGVGRNDERQQLLIGPLALAGLAQKPIVIAAAGDAQHRTDL